MRDKRAKEGPRAEWSVWCRQFFGSLFWSLYFPWYKVQPFILPAHYFYIFSSCDGLGPSWYARIRTVEFFWKKSASISITTKNTKGHETYQIWKSQQICAYSCWWWPITWMVPITLPMRFITRNIACWYDLHSIRNWDISWWSLGINSSRSSNCLGESYWSLAWDIFR